MGTITLKNLRTTADVKMNATLKDGGVFVDWASLSDIKAWLWSDTQRALAGRCDVRVDANDSTKLICEYASTKPQYPGVNRLIVQASYMGATKTYDKQAFNFVRWTGDQAGQQVTIDDPEVDVAIEVTDVTSSILQEVIAAALAAAAHAEHAASLVPLQVLQDCEQATAEAREATEEADAAAEHATPYIGENGHWWRWSKTAGAYVDTGEVAQGPTGNGIQSVVQTQTSQESEGENVVTVTMTDGTQEQFTIRNGKQGIQGIQGQPGVANAKYKQVETLPEAGAETMDFIYLTPSQETGVYDMSYTEQDGDTYTWKPLGTTAIQLSDYATKTEVSQLEAKVDGLTFGAEIEQLSPEIVTGKYIYNNGVVGSSGGLNYTAPFHLNSGDLLTIKAKGYNQAIAILSKVIEEDVSYEPIIISIDSTVREYDYIVSRPGDYACCYANSEPITITRVVNAPLSVLEKLTDLNAKTTYPDVAIVPGKYINASGNEGSSAAYNRTVPFELNPAESVVLYATGVAGVSMISRYDGNGYTPLVVSTAEESRIYSYTNITNAPINIVLSYDKNASVHRYIITNNLTAEFGVTLVDGFANVGNKMNGGKYKQFPKVTSGKYVNKNGGVSSSAPFSMSERTFVFAGSVIKVKATGYLTEVAMIAEYLPEEGGYVVRSRSTDSSEHEYTYTTPNDGFFVFSYLTASGIELSITSQSDLVNEVGQIREDVNGLIKNTPQNLLSAFDNIVAVGDSLTYSQVYTGSNTARQAKVPYPIVLARIAGNTATIVAQSGASASGIWDNHKDEIVAKENAIGIVYLGTNEGLTDSVDTDASGDDPDTWANNNTGDYCRIVNKMVSLGYRVVLVRPWTTSGTLADTISAIDDVAEKFGVAVLGAPIMESKFHLYPDGQGSNAVHLNDFGYAVFAQRLAAAIFSFDDAMLQRIFPQ